MGQINSGQGTDVCTGTIIVGLENIKMVISHNKRSPQTITRSMMVPYTGFKPVPNDLEDRCSFIKLVGHWCRWQDRSRLFLGQSSPYQQQLMITHHKRLFERVISNGISTENVIRTREIQRYQRCALTTWLPRYNEARSRMRYELSLSPSVCS